MSACKERGSDTAGQSSGSTTRDHINEATELVLHVLCIRLTPSSTATQHSGRDGKPRAQPHQLPSFEVLRTSVKKWLRGGIHLMKLLCCCTIFAWTHSQRRDNRIPTQKPSITFSPSTGRPLSVSSSFSLATVKDFAFWGVSAIISSAVLLDWEGKAEG